MGWIKTKTIEDEYTTSVDEHGRRTLEPSLEQQPSGMAFKNDDERMEYQNAVKCASVRLEKNIKASKKYLQAMESWLNEREKRGDK